MGVRLLTAPCAPRSPMPSTITHCALTVVAPIVVWTCLMRSLPLLYFAQRRQSSGRLGRWWLLNATQKVEQCVKTRSLVTKSGSISKMLQELKTGYSICSTLVQQRLATSAANKFAEKADSWFYDFAENYKCSFQREVQSAYYSQESVTVHPIVSCTCYRKLCDDLTQPCKCFSTGSYAASEVETFTAFVNLL